MTPERPHRVPNDGMATSGPLQSISDRLLPSELLKTDFHSEIGPGGCARAKDMLYGRASKKGTFQDFHDFRASGDRV